MFLSGLGLDDGQLDTRHEADAFSGQGFAEGGQPIDRIVIRQGRHPDAGGGHPLGQLLGRKLAIAELGMAVEVDAGGFGHFASRSLVRAASP